MKPKDQRSRGVRHLPPYFESTANQLSVDFDLDPKLWAVEALSAPHAVKRLLAAIAKFGCANPDRVAPGEGDDEAGEWLTDPSKNELATAAGVSKSAVKKWLSQFMETPYLLIAKGQLVKIDDKLNQEAHTYWVPWLLILTAAKVTRVTCEKCPGSLGESDPGHSAKVTRVSDPGHSPPAHGGGDERLKVLRQGEGFSLPSEAKEKPSHPPTLPAERRVPRGVWRPWIRECLAANLADPATVDKLFELADRLLPKWPDTPSREEHRRLVFAEAAKAVRTGREKTVEDPRAIFATNVMRADWNAGDADGDEAKRMMARAQGRHVRTEDDRYLAVLQAEADAASQRRETAATCREIAKGLAAKMSVGK